MITVKENKYIKVISSNNGVITFKIYKKIHLSLILIIIGAALMWGVGYLIGWLIDIIPFINEWIPEIVYYISGIEISGNIRGLGGLLGALYGAGDSGLKLNKDSLELEKISISLVSLDPSKIKK